MKHADEFIALESSPNLQTHIRFKNKNNIITNRVIGEEQHPVGA